MAKKAQPPTNAAGEQPDYGSGTIKIDPELAWKAKAIAHFRGQSINDILEPLIRDHVEADYAAITKAQAKLVRGQPPGGGSSSP